MDGRLIEKVGDYFLMHCFRATAEDPRQGLEQMPGDVEAWVSTTHESGWIAETAEDPADSAIGSVTVQYKSRMAKQIQVSANGGRGGCV